jgi:hypothetical protein
MSNASMELALLIGYSALEFEACVYKKYQDQSWEQASLSFIATFKKKEGRVL